MFACRHLVADWRNCLEKEFADISWDVHVSLHELLSS